MTCPFGASKKINSCRDNIKSRSGTRGVGRKGGHKRSDSIPSPTWESKGPEGLVRQVLSLDEGGIDGDAGRVIGGAGGADGTDEEKIGGVLFLGEPAPWRVGRVANMGQITIYRLQKITT